MRLGPRQLNRTLLARQHLLARSDVAPEEMIRHLVGLQAQEPLPPYLSLHARLDAFDPHAVSAALEERRLVRLLVMRGTIHLIVPDDALTLRTWTQPRMAAEMRASQNVKAALGVDMAAFDDALSEVLGAGPLPQRRLAAALGERFPGVPAAALGQLARVRAPLAQLPPRGCWKRSGGVVYQYVDRWLGRPMGEPDVPEIVRRYLRAFGPATAADVTAWSGITRLGPLLVGMDDLARHDDERGRVLYDVPDGEIADEDAPAPVRLLGVYDNLWLSHTGRDRVTTPESRQGWAGSSGGAAGTLFADGMLTGLWRVDDGRVEVLALLRPLTPPERAGLEQEIARVEALLAR